MTSHVAPICLSSQSDLCLFPQVSFELPLSFNKMFHPQWLLYLAELTNGSLTFSKVYGKMPHYYLLYIVKSSQTSLGAIQTQGLLCLST